MDGFLSARVGVQGSIGFCVSQPWVLRRSPELSRVCRTSCVSRLLRAARYPSRLAVRANLKADDSNGEKFLSLQPLKKSVNRALFTTGLYIFVAGALLLIKPELLPLLAPGITDTSTGLAAQSSVGVSLFWIRVGGILCQLFGIYYLADALLPDRRGFAVGSVIGRFYLFAMFLGFYLFNASCPLIIPLFGIINFLSATMTAVHLWSEREKPANLETGSAETIENPSSPPFENTEEGREPVALESFQQRVGYDNGRLLVSLSDSNVSIVNVEFSSNGEKLVVALSNGRVLIFDAQSGLRLQEINHRGLQILGAGFCDNGNVWASCVDQNTDTALCYLHRKDNFALLKKISLPRDEAYSIEFTPDGIHYLVRKPNDNSMLLQLRSTENPRAVEWEQQVGLNGILSTRLLWSKNRKLLIAGGGTSFDSAAVTVLRARDGKPVFVGKTKSIPVSVDLDLENDRVLASCLDRRIRVFDIQSAKKVLEVDLNSFPSFNMVARFSQDGSSLLLPFGDHISIRELSENCKPTGNEAENISTGTRMNGRLRNVDLDTSTGAIAASTPLEVSLWHSM